MKQRGKQCIIALFLLCNFQLVQSSDKSNVSPLVTPRQRPYDKVDFFNPLLDKRYNPQELTEKARLALDDLEPKLAEILSELRDEQVGTYTCNVNRLPLRKLLREYNYDSGKYESYAVYVTTWMLLKSTLWAQLEQRKDELGVVDWLAGKMGHPVLRQIRKQHEKVDEPSK